MTVLIAFIWISASSPKIIYDELGDDLDRKWHLPKSNASDFRPLGCECKGVTVGTAILL